MKMCSNNNNILNKHQKKPKNTFDNEKYKIK